MISAESQCRDLALAVFPNVVSKTLKQKSLIGKTRSAGLDFDSIKAVALALPEVEESTSYATPAFKVRGKLMLRLREDSETIVLKISWEDSERLLLIAPATFFMTEHYRGYRVVLVRLALLNPGQLPALLEHAWRDVAQKALLKKYVEGKNPAS